MCNLYSQTKSQDAMRHVFDNMVEEGEDLVDLTGNLRESNLGVLMGSLQGDCENCRLLGAYQAAREDAHA